jgi:hypothetical protein
MGDKDQGCPLGARDFFFFSHYGRPEGIGGRIRLTDSGWRLTDGGWLMTNRSYSPTGALQRFECTGGWQFPPLLVLRTALMKTAVWQAELEGIAVKHT